MRRDPPRTLGIFLYGSHGDIALQSSFTQFIRARHPQASITLLTAARCAHTASLNPDLSQVVPVELPPLWGYRHVEALAEVRGFDLFLNASFDPDLRHLIPQMPLVEMPYFLFRERPRALPRPRLVLDFSPTRREPYVLLNLEAGTLGGHPATPGLDELAEMKRGIVAEAPGTRFVVNDGYGVGDRLRGPNVETFSGSFRDLLRVAAESAGVISLRNGLCDVLAASTEVPQFVCFTDGRVPNERGIPAVQWAGMLDLGYPAKIDQCLVRRGNLAMNMGAIRQATAFAARCGAGSL